MESLREEKMRLSIALSQAISEKERADRLLSSGDITFRMYLEFEGRIENIRAELAATEADIMGSLGN